MSTSGSTYSLQRIVDAAHADVDPASLRDKYRGVMLGLAAGNALGLPVEGHSRQSIRRHFGEGVTEIDPAERERPWDDDLAQAAILAEELIASGELDPRRLADRFVTWARDNGRGMGTLTGAVIDELEKGGAPNDAARRAWERNPLSGAGNGALMRCPPIALRHPGSGVALVRNARTSALVTHYDARCEWSTVVTCVAITTCLGGHPVTLEELAGATAAIGGEGWLADAIAEVVGAIEVTTSSLDDLKLDDPMDMGYTIKAMRVALWSMVNGGSLEEGLIEIVARGGDTDTNAAVAGAVMGAIHGAAAIPQRWAENLAEVERVTRLADGLFEAAAS